MAEIIGRIYQRCKERKEIKLVGIKTGECIECLDRKMDKIKNED